VSHTSKTASSSITNLESKLKTVQFIHSTTSTPDDAYPISMIEVKSREQPHVSLGHFTDRNPPKGFAIHISPDPEPDAIVTQVTRLEDGEDYELVLHIANYGNKNVSAEIWRL
jgi:hypothetical protein